MAVSTSMAGARQGGQKRVYPKPPAGKHIAKVIDIEWRKTFNKGQACFISYEVVQPQPGSACPVGFQGSFDFFPEDVRPQRISREQAIAYKMGDIQRALAAVCGYPKEEASVIQDPEFNWITASPRAPDPDNNVVSPVAGRLFVVESEDYQGKHGPTTIQEVAVHEPSGKLDLKAAVLGRTPAAQAAPSAPPPPVAAPAAPPPPAALTFEQKAEAAGWKIHPQSNAHWYQGDQVVTADALRAQLG